MAKKLTASERKEAIDTLIQNSADGTWTEKDRSVLDGFSSRKLVNLLEQTAVVNAALSGAAPVINKAKEDVDDEPIVNEKKDPELLDALPDITKIDGQVVVNRVAVEGGVKYRLTVNGKPYEAPKPTVNSGATQIKMEDLPQELREDIMFARNAKQQQKDSLIQRITANSNNAFPKEVLATKSIEELGMLAKLATPAHQQQVTAPSMGNFMGNNAPPVLNRGDFNEDDILPLPMMNYKEEKATA